MDASLMKVRVQTLKKIKEHIFLASIGILIYERFIFRAC